MSPQEIASRLNDLFRLLTGGRHRVQRQQTLETALDWSYGLLADEERMLLRRLAVFSGNFGLEAAEGVCDADVLDGLASLVAKSLVTIEEQDGRTRYRLIETVRQYAAKKLHEAGESDAFRARHRDWYQTWVESHAWEEVFRPYADLRPPNWVEEHANLRAAMEWSEAEARTDLVVRMAARLWRLWVNSGFFEEGFRWLEGAEDPNLDIPTEDRVAALCGGTILALLMSKPGAADLGERAVEVSSGEPSVPLTRAFAWRGISRAVRAALERDADLGTAARRDIEQALEMAHALGIRPTELLHYKGNIELILGDMQAAEDAFTLAADGAVDPEFMVYRAAPAHILGHDDLALESAQHIIGNFEHFRRLATWFGYLLLAAVSLAGVGRFDEARERLRSHIEDVRRSAMLGSIEELVLGFAIIAHLQGDHERASRLLGWIGSRTLEIGRFMPSGTGPPLYVHYVHLVRRALDPETAHRCRAEGRALSEDEAITLALEEPVLRPTT